MEKEDSNENKPNVEMPLFKASNYSDPANYANIKTSSIEKELRDIAKLVQRRSLVLEEKQKQVQHLQNMANNELAKCEETLNSDDDEFQEYIKNCQEKIVAVKEHQKMEQDGYNKKIYKSLKRSIKFQDDMHEFIDQTNLDYTKRMTSATQLIKKIRIQKDSMKKKVEELLVIATKEDFKSDAGPSKGLKEMKEEEGNDTDKQDSAGYEIYSTEFETESEKGSEISEELLIED